MPSIRKVPPQTNTPTTSARTKIRRAQNAGPTPLPWARSETRDTQPTLTGTCPVPLHHPDQPTLPDTAWVPMLPAIAARVTPAPAGAAPVALLLLDRNTGRHALVGPFPHHRAAQAWQPTPPAGPDIDRDVPTAPPADFTGWLQP